MMYSTAQRNPELDLFFERQVDIAPKLVWDAWTTPEHITHWFTPAPWKTIECEIDLRPAGLFRTLMLSPEGQEFPNVGCYLEIVPNEKLVWTNALAPGFRPLNKSWDSEFDFPFTASILLEPQGDGTKYSACVVHRSEEDRKKHESMGFEEGWGKALDQLVAHMRSTSH